MKTSLRPRVAFTLVELMVAVAVLTILVGILAQVVVLSGQAISNSRKKLDAAGQARMVFDRLATDLAARPRRADLGMIFAKGGGNGASDSLQFYSEVSGYSGKRVIASISYQVPTTSSSSGLALQLQRAATGTDWSNENPLVFLGMPANQNGGGPASPAAPNAADFEVLASGVFRLEFCFLRNDGTIGNSSGSSTGSATDYSNVSALLVAIAVLDDTSLKLINLTQLQALANDLPACADGEDPLTTWSGALAGITKGTGFPAAVRQNLRVYQRAFKLY